MTYLFKQSKQILSLQSKILQNNDLYEGRDKLIENIDKYYDGLELDTSKKKLARWKRTPFYLYYPKVISSFTSSIFKKPPHFELPGTEEDIKNVDLLGNNINEYVANIPEQVLKQGFCATIVDYSDILSRPFLTFIKPENFVSFQVSNYNGYPELSQFIYQVIEDVKDPTDEFALKSTKVHYVWDLIDYEENNVIKRQVRVRKYIRIQVEEDKTDYSKRNDKTEYSDELQSTTLLTMGGEPLNKLPIVIHGKESNNFTVNKSVLQDVSDLNINIFQRVVDQIEVLHLTAVPTPWITSDMDAEDENRPTTIGSSKLWMLPEGASVGMLEFSGASAQAHRDYIEDLKEAMAITGAQILKKQGVSRETATSVLIRTGQETAVITDIVINISSQIEEILGLYFKWMNKEGSILYKLNSDFLSVDMEPNAQIALVRSWLDGAISHESMFRKMKEGELIPANRTFEEELALIKQNPPTFPSKEKDAKIAESLAKLKEKLSTTPDLTGGNQETNLKGSNMQIDNGTKNTEIKN